LNKDINQQKKTYPLRSARFAIVGPKVLLCVFTCGGTRWKLQCVLVCVSKVIGGYSLLDYDEVHDRCVYSLEGKTLEKVTGEDFQTWREAWEAKYKK